jgi:hypothetical protein
VERVVPNALPKSCRAIFIGAFGESTGIVLRTSRSTFAIAFETRRSTLHDALTSRGGTRCPQRVVNSGGNAAVICLARCFLMSEVERVVPNALLKKLTASFYHRLTAARRFTSSNHPRHPWFLKICVHSWLGIRHSDFVIPSSFIRVIRGCPLFVRIRVYSSGSCRIRDWNKSRCGASFDYKLIAENNMKKMIRFFLFGTLFGVIMAAAVTFALAIPGNSDHWREEIVDRGGGAWYFDKHGHLGWMWTVPKVSAPAHRTTIIVPRSQPRPHSSNVQL